MTPGTDRISALPVEPTATNQFASLSLARAYIDTVGDGAGSLDAGELIDAVARLDRAYREFPELELDSPRRELSVGLRSAAGKLPARTAIPLLIRIVAFDPSCLSPVTSLLKEIDESDGWQSLLPILRSLNPSTKFPWHAVEPLVNTLRQRGGEDVILQIILELLKHLNFVTEIDAADFGDILARTLSDEDPAGIDGIALARAAQSARHRRSQPPPGRNKPGSRDWLLAMAERLRVAPPPQRSDQHPDLSWPSGRLSFDEFLLQWPCAIELPADLSDQALIEEAYQAILLRDPSAAELQQYLRLLQNGAISKLWIIEDLLASEELRALERRLRVIWGGNVITEPGRPEAEEMPAVMWPWRPAT